VLRSKDWRSNCSLRADQEKSLREKIKHWVALYKEIAGLPRISINLMLAGAADNDPFFQKITQQFHKNANSRHPKFPLIRRMEFGFALCKLREDERPYSARLDSAARRNLKKAARLGYRFERIDYNAHLADVTRIHQSTTVRQGREMPADLITKEAGPHSDPPSRNPRHDYPYFGIFKDEQLVAYASCMVAGELCALQTIYGHADFLSDGVVPLLIASIGDDVPIQHPDVLYYAYDTYYGASDTMKRFKRKFLFFPHRVTWLLGN